MFITPQPPIIPLLITPSLFSTNVETRGSLFIFPLLHECGEALLRRSGYAEARG